MKIDQIIILILSPIAIRLLASNDRKLRLYGCIFGLVGQPFYHWSTYVNEQWGMFIVSLWFTYSYYKGLRNNIKE